MASKSALVTVKATSPSRHLAAARKGAIGSKSLVAISVLVVIVPIIWLVLTSLRYTRQIMSERLITGLTGSNFSNLLAPGNSFIDLFRNSLFVTVISTVVVMVVSSFAAYSLSKYRWPKWVSAILMGWGVLINVLPQIAMVPALYAVARTTGLYNTPWILVAVYTFFNAPLALVILKVGFDSVPVELIEAARIDGASDGNIFRSIAVPLILPSIVAAGLLIAIMCWDDFVLALSLTSTSASMTIPVGLSTYVQQYQISYGPMAAGAVIAIVPVLLLIIFAQKYLIKGLTGGAVKG